MFEDKYPLTTLEANDVKAGLAFIAEHGKLFDINRMTGQPVIDGDGNPKVVHYIRLAGSPTLRCRFILDHNGLVWPFKARGSDKCPHLPDKGGSPHRSDYVEMWTGNWRKVKNPDKPGEMTYAKYLIDINMSNNVQGHPTAAKIDWMRQKKGFKHPYEDPQAPNAVQLGSLESRQRAMAPVIYAQMQGELQKQGIEKSGEYLDAARRELDEKTTPVAGPAPDPTLRPAPITMATAAEATPPETPVAAPEPPAEPTVAPGITDQARIYAEANGLDISAVKGTGRNGRIVIGDVRDRVGATPATPPAAQGRSNQG